MTEVAKVLMAKEGCSKVWAVATHPVLSGPAIQRLNDSPIESLFVTDTIPLGAKGEQTSKIKQLSVAGLLADGIARIHNEDSVSELFV